RKGTPTPVIVIGPVVIAPSTGIDVAVHINVVDVAIDVGVVPIHITIYAIDAPSVNVGAVDVASVDVGTVDVASVNVGAVNVASINAPSVKTSRVQVAATGTCRSVSNLRAHTSSPARDGCLSRAKPHTTDKQNDEDDSYPLHCLPLYRKHLSYSQSTPL